MEFILIAMECSCRSVSANQLDDAKHFNTLLFSPASPFPVFHAVMSKVLEKYLKSQQNIEMFWNVFILHIRKVICVWGVFSVINNFVMIVRHRLVKSIEKFCQDYYKIFAKEEQLNVDMIWKLIWFWHVFLFVTNFHLFCH